ncbi:MAG TPA: hypothetical protein DDY39_18400 [Nitrospira sp.]|nr:hypothetical protein [Nitrospira sp.]
MVIHRFTTFLGMTALSSRSAVSFLSRGMSKKEWSKIRQRGPRDETSATRSTWHRTHALTMFFRNRPDGLSDHYLRTGWNGAKWETEHEAGERTTRRRLRAQRSQSWERLVQISEPRRCLYEREEVWEIGHAGKGQESREIGSQRNFISDSIPWSQWEQESSNINWVETET